MSLRHSITLRRRDGWRPNRYGPIVRKVSPEGGIQLRGSSFGDTASQPRKGGRTLPVRSQSSGLIGFLPGVAFYKTVDAF